MLAVPVAPPRSTAVAGERFEVLALLERDAGLAVGERFLGRLVGVERRVDLDLGLAGAERLGEHRVEVGLEVVVVAFFGGLFAGGAVDAFAVLGGPQELPGAVGDRDLADLQARDGGGDELGDAVHGGGAHVAGPAEQDRRGGGVLVFAEELVLGAGHDELDLRAGDALDVVDRLLELALQRALVGDLLVELAFAEARFFKEREAGLGVAEQAGAGERDARAGGLVGLDGERGAVVLQFVADALGVEGARHLAGLRRFEAGGERGVGRFGDHAHEEVDDEDGGERGAAEDRPAARGEPGCELSHGHRCLFWIWMGSRSVGWGRCGLVAGMVLGWLRAVMLELDLRLEDLLGGFGGLGADLRRELHRELGFLDGDDGALGVADAPGGEALGGGAGALLGLVERGDRVGES